MTAGQRSDQDAEAIARKSAATMWAADDASRHLGMRIDSIGPGRARLSMAITEVMVNGHGSCHGGYIFMLADSAFAFACNAYNQRHVAQACQITYIRPARLGAVLTAEAEERQRAERSGLYDVRVRDEAGEVIAEFRGHSRSIPGTHY